MTAATAALRAHAATTAAAGFYLASVVPLLDEWAREPSDANGLAVRRTLDEFLLQRPDASARKPGRVVAAGLRNGPRNRRGYPFEALSWLAAPEDQRLAWEASLKDRRVLYLEMERDEAAGGDYYPNPRAIEIGGIREIRDEHPWLRDPPPAALVVFNANFAFSRWPGETVQEALISLCDVAFGFGNDPSSNQVDLWTRAWRVDWAAGRFTRLAAGHELTFTRDSA